MWKMIVRQFVQNVLKPSSCEDTVGLIMPRGGKKVEIEFCTIPHHMSSNYMSWIYIKYTPFCSQLFKNFRARANLIPGLVEFEYVY